VLPENPDPPLRLLVAFQEAFPTLSPAYVLPVPGREMWVAAATEDADAFNLHVPDLGGRTTFTWRTAKNKRTVLNRPLPSWSRYSAGVVVTLCAQGLNVPGFFAVAAGEEPRGPRYEYALGMGMAALMHTLHEHTYDADLLLEVMERVQRDYLTG
jgi:hypothetical protein